MSNGIELIAAERERQIYKEGWSPKHDDEHDHCELSNAGLAYIRAAQNAIADPKINDVVVDAFWPWCDDCWKPSKDPIRNLVKAGALIAAEIDRLDRLKRRTKRRKSANAPAHRAPTK